MFMILICPAKPAIKVKYYKNEFAIISHIANFHCWQRKDVSLYKFEIQHRMAPQYGKYYTSKLTQVKVIQLTVEPTHMAT